MFGFSVSSYMLWLDVYGSMDLVKVWYCRCC